MAFRVARLSAFLALASAVSTAEAAYHDARCFDDAVTFRGDDLNAIRRDAETAAAALEKETYVRRADTLSRRRRGRGVDSPRRRVAATPRPRRG